MTVTVAPFTAAPVESVTWPTIEPVVSCEYAVVTPSARAHTTRATIRLSIFCLQKLAENFSLFQKRPELADRPQCLRGGVLLSDALSRVFKNFVPRPRTRAGAPRRAARPSRGRSLARPRR